MAGSSCLAGAARSFKETPQRRLAMKASRSSGPTSTLSSGRTFDGSLLASLSGKCTGIASATSAVAQQASRTPPHWRRLKTIPCIERS